MENQIYKFAAFELNPADGELKGGGATVRLQEKPLRLLCALLDSPQQLITREQLRHRLWDSRTVVNFEQGINVAMKKVRDALADPADDPKIIETLPRKGYRLMVPVEVLGTRRPADAIPVTDDSEPVQPGQGLPAPVARTRAFALTGRFLALALGALCLAGFGLFASDTESHRGARLASLAVLPLRNLSPDPGQAYFADGVTDDITTYLAETLPLRVISRSSVQRFGGTDRAAADIAREFGVDAIVQGSIARSGERLSVVLHLIDARDRRQLWARTFDQGTGDVRAIESELAAAIASRAGAAPGGAHAPLAGAQAVDPKAYDLYLMGHHHLDRRTAADLSMAEQYFRQALQRAPGYAPAYAGLASVYALLPSYGPDAPAASLAKAETAARQALALDDGLAEAHAILALIGLNRSPGWITSEAEFRRAIEIDPNFAAAHHWFAYQRFFVEKTDEAVKEITLARELDPMSAITNADEGHFLYVVRRFEDARFRLKRAIELAPDLGQPHESLALVELETGHPDLALDEARAGLALDPANPRTMGEAGYVFAMVGQRAQAQSLLSRLKTLAAHGSLPLFPAMVEIGLGQRAQALQTLGQAMGAKTAYGLPGIRQWHAFDGIGTGFARAKLADGSS